MKYSIKPFHDHAIYISFGDDIQEDYLYYSQAIISDLESILPIGYVEAIPGYNNLTIFYDPIKIAEQYHTENMQQHFIKEIEQRLKMIDLANPIARDIISIPVCYGDQFGPDLKYVADFHKLSVKEVIQIHSEKIYTVHMLGFAPGFPFLGGMDPTIATPRKSTPAAAIPAGSVGIAGVQTGVYPIETPGGWQIIGRTPTSFFQPTKHPPSLLTAGDKLKFHPITMEEFVELEGENR
ncbi:5-oxoprolinase subunit PxpB [Sporosarcina sp. ACRSL]|uniref:5-oxoprolinase subunit PxpB n=1 Tax=Sporosarcina sp. ACRSL TaxID=2918215 RepID=UPI001EF6B6F3|nr:5-oxoprolinase subunit PxpB [Sporosarcina sp. ACRSL]MCG7344149.1 5-oxoprolinase subunit PxpB [Sporosarcina sp. ACRSL]